MMALYSPLLSGIVLAAVAVYALLRWAFFRPLRAPPKRRWCIEAKQTSHFLESLRGVQAIKLFNRRGRPAGALHEPRGRRDERRHRGAQASS